MKSLFAIDEPHSFKFATNLSGDIISITHALSKLLNQRLTTDGLGNIHQLLLEQSNYNKDFHAEVDKLIKNNTPAIGLLLKLHNLPTLAILSITPIAKITDRKVLYGVIKPIPMPFYSNLLFEPLNLGLVHDRYKIDAQFRMQQLNPKEQAIVYLLCTGLTQREAAEFLGCSRGYIATMLSYSICPKFGMVGGSSKMLVKIVAGLGLFNDFIPAAVADKLQPVML
jgi:hypothetical protein